ncbi:MAG: CoB--CoM heterodisulfide reductase iron-sulfur subunit A family protein [Bacteroidales bacterium]|nr:CoB--CoM heterodisulfide reductase iron-sulfur subunit A family protein [Bacteroidales bacterium]
MSNKLPILIIGGGISGVTTAIEAAETGYEAIIVEKLPYLGGRVIKINQYFPKLCPPFCGLEINFRRIKQNKKIKLITSSIVEEITGEKGNFFVKIKTKPNYVNDNCTACGDCVNVCLVERNDEYNYGISKTKAIYLPNELAFPFKYTIDEEFCEKENCNKCKEACKYDAIDFSCKEEISVIRAGAIVFATGWKPFPAEKIINLKYGVLSNIITNVVMERLMAPNGPTQGKVLRPSDNKPPKKIAFVQCAGSRDENYLPYCSGVCCSASLKQALNFVEQDKDAQATIFYIDLRVSGRNEDFLEKVKNHDRVFLIKGKAGNIEENIENKNLIVEAEDIFKGQKIKDEFDLVVLATGIVPEKLSINQIKVDKNGFILEDELPEGIMAVSNTKKPMDVSASLKDATGKTLKAIQIINS